MKMKQSVIIASLLLIALNFNGCCCKQVEYVNVPQKCVIPKVPEPIIDNNAKHSSADIVTKALNNYIAIKEYAEKLLASQAVCE